MVTVVELRSEAKKKKIPMYSTMNKTQLCHALAEVGVTFNDCAKGARKTKRGSPKKKTATRRSPLKGKGKRTPPKRKSVPKKTATRRNPLKGKDKIVFKNDIMLLYRDFQPDNHLTNQTKMALDKFSQRFIQEIAPQLIGMGVDKVSFKGLLPPEFEKYARVEKFNTQGRIISFAKVDLEIRKMGMKLHEEIVFFLRNVLEFILSDMLELGYNEARIKGKVNMTLTHLRTAVEEDTELRQMPGIQAIL